MRLKAVGLARYLLLLLHQHLGDLLFPFLIFGLSVALSERILLRLGLSACIGKDDLALFEAGATDHSVTSQLLIDGIRKVFSTCKKLYDLLSVCGYNNGD